MVSVDTMGSSLTRFEWQFGSPPEACGVHVPSILRHWHKARLVGLELDRLSVGPLEVDPRAVERLNLFLASGGGWQIASMDYWKARQVLDRVLRL